MFSSDLVNSMSSFVLGAFGIMSGVATFKNENLIVNSQSENENNVVGFGNSFVADSNSSDTKTPEDIEKLMQEAVSAYASFEKTGEIEETTLLETSSTISYGNVIVNNKTETKY